MLALALIGVMALVQQAAKPRLGFSSWHSSQRRWSVNASITAIWFRLLGHFRGDRFLCREIFVKILFARPLRYPFPRCRTGIFDSSRREAENEAQNRRTQTEIARPPGDRYWQRLYWAGRHGAGAGGLPGLVEQVKHCRL